LQKTAAFWSGKSGLNYDKNQVFPLYNTGLIEYIFTIENLKKRSFKEFIKQQK
jgi:hypothetical protein